MEDGIFAHWPNRITALRFVGSIFLFILLTALEGDEPARVTGLLQVAFWLFLVIAITDLLDGYLARRDNQVTAFGRIADPFVDKVMVIGTMVYLAVLDWSQPWFPAWVVVVVVAREFLVTGLRGYVESRGLAFPADWFGKVKMLFQCIAIEVVIGQFAFALEWSEGARSFWAGTGHFFVWATVLATLGSGTSYVLKTKRILSDGAI